MVDELKMAIEAIKTALENVKVEKWGHDKDGFIFFRPDPLTKHVIAEIHSATEAYGGYIAACNPATMANLLGSYDDLVAQNRQMTESLIQSDKVINEVEAYLLKENEAAPPAFIMNDALMRSPFCGGKADPEGWSSNDGRKGPACDECGATAQSAEIWNSRREIDSNAKKDADIKRDMRDDPDWNNHLDAEWSKAVPVVPEEKGTINDPVTDREARLWIAARAIECEELYRSPLVALKRSDEFGYQGKILRRVEAIITKLETENERLNKNNELLKLKTENGAVNPQYMEALKTL